MKRKSKFKDDGTLTEEAKLEMQGGNNNETESKSEIDTNRLYIRDESEPYFPDWIKVGGHNLEIRDVEEIFDRKEGYGIGAFYKNAGYIEVAQKNQSEHVISESIRYETLIHEILHAVNYFNNFDRMNEQQVDIMSQGLFQVIKDNPHVFKPIWDI